MSCVFCDLTANDNDVTIIEPLNPVTPGHRIAIPREHVRDAGDDPTVTAKVMAVASSYAASLGTDYNIITSSGKNATQSVFHLHIHIIPRREGDGLALPWTGQHRRVA
jgi:histidine triad (HIT) family protein